MRKVHDTASTKVFECAECTYRCNDSTVFRNHRQSKHCAIEKKTCVECGQQLSSRRMLLRHMRRVHSETLPFPCDQCPGRFMTMETLRRHNIAHEGNVSRQQDNNVRCRLCERTFAAPNDILHHIKAIHVGTSLFRCCQCDVGVSTHDHLLQHIHKTHLKLENGSVMPQCAHCGRRFQRAYDIEPHYLSEHVNDLLVQCAHCDFASNTPQFIYDHLRRWHASEKNFGE